MKVRNPTLTAILLLALVAVGAGTRMVALEKVPPGFAPDEATNGYDAYCLLKTGRDQHGYYLPLVMRSFNDYRMPLFIYSIVPFIGLFSLNVNSVRMASAFWGILTIPAGYWLGRNLYGRQTGLITAFLLALSPWLIPLNRIALESGMVTCLLTLSMAIFWQWHNTHKAHWLPLGTSVAALCIYTYSTAKLLIPGFLALIGILWFKERKNLSIRAVLIAAGIFLILVIPVVYLTIRYREPMQARYNQIAVFRQDRSFYESLSKATKNFVNHFSISYLFIRGDADTLQHPPFGGQLYWIQAPLLLLGILWGWRSEKRELLLFLLGWLFLTALPPALTRPNLPNSAHSLRNLPAVVPFQILTAYAAARILGHPSLGKRAKHAIAILLVILLVGQGTWFLYKYYTVYPSLAAGRFEDGIKEMITEMDKYDDQHSTVYFTDRIGWPYIYVAFFTKYDPEKFLAAPPVRSDQLFAPVERLGNYHVVPNIEEVYSSTGSGLFIGEPDSFPDVTPLTVIHRPTDGKPRYKIVSK